MRARLAGILIVACGLSLCVSTQPRAASAFAGAAGTAARQAQQTSERLRVLFPRAELMLRTGDVDGALATLDRLIDLAEQGAGSRSDADRLLLRRAYELRAALRWEQGDRRVVDDDLDRMIELDPAYEPGEGSVAGGLLRRFGERRERKVGYLRIGRFPATAAITVDGRPLDQVPEVLPVLAGDHEVRGALPGHAPAVEQVRVRANRTEGVGITLQRSSATLRLATRPAGATLVLDDELIGRTESGQAAGDLGDDAAEPASEPLVVDGLLPGWYELEVALPGFRPFRQRLEVPDLADYDLGLLELQRSMGVLQLRGVPADARVLIDAEPAATDSSGPVDAARLSLTIGAHSLLVDAGRAGVFEAAVSIGDGETTSVDVRIQPAIAWLGSIGGDALDRDAVATAVVPELSAAGDWALLDRSVDAAALWRRADIDPAAMAGGDPDVWEIFRGETREAIGAGVFLLAVLPPQRPVSYADLYLWGADEALPGEVLRFELGTRGGLQELLDGLQRPLPVARAWLGAQTMIDPAGGVVVVDVASGSPAAQAGLRFGERIVALDGAPIATSAAVAQSVAAAAPFSSVVLDLDGIAGRRTVRVTLGSSPVVPPPQSDPGLAPLVWAAAAAQIARSDSEYPAWSMQLLQATLALRAGQPQRAVELLAVAAPTATEPFGAAALDYWHGVALLSLPDPDTETAAMVLRRAAGSAGGRMFHNDGPLVAPAARARMRALGLR